MIFMAFTHQVKGVETISEAGAHVGFILLLPMIGWGPTTIGWGGVEILYSWQVLSLAEMKASVCEQKNSHTDPTGNRTRTLYESPVSYSKTQHHHVPYTQYFVLFKYWSIFKSLKYNLLQELGLKSFLYIFAEFSAY
jgi:hypothetical protein